MNSSRMLAASARMAAAARRVGLHTGAGRTRAFHARPLAQRQAHTLWPAAPTSASGASATGPFAGLRVLDLSRILAGPYCTMMLGDQGADVLKVEDPEGGDATRTWGPPFLEHGEAVYFMAVNRNKRSITLDLKSSADKQKLVDLASQADVLVENYVPGKLDALGLGYEALAASNPRLIYLSVSGFGPTGPYAQRPGFDVIAAGIGGLLHITGQADGPPAKVGVAITDVCTGLFANGAIAAALYAREKTGRGQRIDVSLLETQVAVLVNIAANYIMAGREGKRWGTAHESIVPYQAFACADGKYVIVGAGTDGQWRKLARTLGDERLADARFATNAARVAQRDELLAILQSVIGAKPAAHWLASLAAVGVPYGPINSLAEVFADPQVLHRDMLTSVPHSRLGALPMVGLPVKYSETPCSIRLAPPDLGEHNDALRRDDEA